METDYTLRRHVHSSGALIYKHAGAVYRQKHKGKWYIDSQGMYQWLPLESVPTGYQPGTRLKVEKNINFCLHFNCL